MNNTGLSPTIGTSPELYPFVKFKIFRPLFYTVSGTKEIHFTKSDKNVMFSLSFFHSLFTGPKVTEKYPYTHSTICIAQHNAENTSA